MTALLMAPPLQHAEVETQYTHYVSQLVMRHDRLEASVQAKEAECVSLQQLNERLSQCSKDKDKKGKKETSATLATRVQQLEAEKIGVSLWSKCASCGWANGCEAAVRDPQNTGLPCRSVLGGLVGVLAVTGVGSLGRSAAPALCACRAHTFAAGAVSRPRCYAGGSRGLSFRGSYRD